MSFWESLYQTFIVAKDVAPYGVGEEYRVLIHIFWIIPWGIIMFLVSGYLSRKSHKTKERALTHAAIALILVMVIRAVWFFIYEPQDAPTRAFGFEISEYSAYAVILAALFIKKDWFYKIAFPLGILSFLGCYLVPYTQLKGISLFSFKIQISIVYHWLNGFIPMMLVYARGYRPKIKDWWIVAITMLILFSISYVMCIVQDRNWIWLQYMPNSVPILNKIPHPYYIPILYVGFTVGLIILLGACEGIEKAGEKVRRNLGIV